MAKTTLLLIALMLIVFSTAAQLSSKPGNCPMRNTVTQCTPSCVSDFQCSLNSKCCPNKCGHSSCASPSAVGTGSDGGYKGSHRDEGVYCGGRKCSRYEKCEFDRTTKREKCVRT